MLSQRVKCWLSFTSSGSAAARRLRHQSSCDCGNAYKDDEELQHRGVAAIWFNLVNSRNRKAATTLMLKV